MEARFNRTKSLICICTLVAGLIFISGNSEVYDTGKHTKLQRIKTDNIYQVADNHFAVNIDRSDISDKESHKAVNSRTLSGIWMVVPDSNDLGLQQEWWKYTSYPQQQGKAIPIPGNTYEALPGYNGTSWYLRVFELNSLPQAGRRSFLHFGAVQYRCRVWINGQEVGSHEGGESPIEFEVTGKIIAGSNTLILRVENPPGIHRNGAVPVRFDPGGIVANVDLVEQPRLRIADVYARPDPETGTIKVEVTCDNAGDPAMVEIHAIVTEHSSHEEKDKTQLSVKAPVGNSVYYLKLKVKSPHMWDLDDPFLYSVEVSSAANGEEDIHHIEHLGFRDFRIVDGFFYLNGRRIFLKCTHASHYDPILIQGVSRDMRWLGIDAAKLKAAGFNTFRSLASAYLPEQLAVADEVGLLMYSEHAGSWLLRDSTKFLIELPDIIRRDRHSPSLVMFGLLNEIDKRSPGVYNVARNSLPLIRSIDETRLIILSSGRWDRDLSTGSASNPGSTTWDVFLGGEGPKPIPTGTLPDLTKQPDLVKQLGILDGGYSDGGGDLHVYHTHPTSWDFINALRHLAVSTNPVFLSEGGCGSTFDCYTDLRKLIETRAPLNAELWNVANSRIKELEAMWKRYGLSVAYEQIPAMIAESQEAAARERDIYTRAVRSNPNICGYSLTSLIGGNTGEGIWDKFRDWKCGHQAVVTAGWAPTRFCLFVNPVPITAGKSFRLIASLVDEDRLQAGSHSVTLKVRNDDGNELWTKNFTFSLDQLGKRPFASLLFDEELPALPLTEGLITIEATLQGTDSLPGDNLQVPVFDALLHPHIGGTIETLGLTSETRALLIKNGAKVKEYNPSVKNDRQVIVCGSRLPAGWNTNSWRSVYEQVACGAHLLILGPAVLSGKNGPNHYLPVAQHGKLECGPNWLYHCEVIAKPGLVFEGLPARLLTGEVYGRLLNSVLTITGATPPEKVIAVAFNGSGEVWAYQPTGSSKPQTMQRMRGLNDGLVIASWKLGTGMITVCTMDITAQLGSPVSDRLLINLVRYALANTEPLHPLPANFDSELDTLGIMD